MAEITTTCDVCVDSDEIVDLYQKLRTEVVSDLDEQFDKGRINGTYYVDAYIKLMDRVIGASVQGVISLQTNETDADRCVKQSTCEVNSAKIIRDDELADAEIAKQECDCEQNTKITDSKIALNAAQENKLACDCCNASKLADADVVLKAQQGDLYDRQRQGFDDNARQKLFDSQLNSWAMVFADTALEEVVAPTNEQQICETYNAVKSGLGITGSACE